MGKRGPKTQPASTAKRKGTYQPCRHGDDAAPTTELPCPADLSDKAAKWWSDLAPLLGRLNVTAETDSLALRLLCDAAADYLVARQEVEQSGLTTHRERGDGVVMHPAVRIRDNAWDRLLKACRDFGMTPSARTGVNMNSGDKEEDDEAADILQIRQKGA